ncbi:hypothetical protein AUT26_16620 [[Arthrobacter] sp. ATCC 21022]|nr:hypothetical protein AUT26_16620 [Arthrobacter sp. ATCC 21022]KUR64486.1 hypothetical protein JM67_10675 [Arthrobacter sp. ATCC 21022]
MRIISLLGFFMSGILCIKAVTTVLTSRERSESTKKQSVVGDAFRTNARRQKSRTNLSTCSDWDPPTSPRYRQWVLR